jgi:hypothetical protein
VITSALNGKGVTFLSAGEPEHDAAFYGFTHDILDLFKLSSDYSVHLYSFLLPKLKKLQDNNDGVDLIVFDHLFWPAGHALSRDLSAKAVMLYPGLIGLEHLGMEPDYVPMIISGVSSPICGTGSLPNRIQNFVMLRVARYILQTFRTQTFSSAIKELGINDIPYSFLFGHTNPYGKTRLALHGSYMGLGEVARNQQSMASAMTQSTGPWLPRSTSLPFELSVLLEDADGPPVIFIAIGTNAYWSSNIMEIFVQFLLEMKKTKAYHILWSMKHRDVEEYLMPALSRVGRSLGDLTEDPTHASGRGVLTLVPFVDQFAVLQSKKVAAFVSHCGFSSMQEALHTGTPVLAMPMMLDSDQVTNAARLVQLGVAESFDSRFGKDDITFSALLRKINALTNNPKLANVTNIYKEKSLELSRVSQRLQGPKRAADWLEIEMDGTGTQFMTGVEEQLSWVEQSSIDIYSILFVVFVLLLLTLSRLCCRRTNKQTIALARKKD